MLNIFKSVGLFLVALLTSSAVFADAIILNRNFESDVIPLDPGYTSLVSGWVKSGDGAVGVNAPFGSGIHYQKVGKQVQVGYLEQGGRLGQVTNLVLTQGKTYTLTFDAGQRLDQTGRNFVARIKVNGLILAQKHSNDFNLTSGEWSTETLTLSPTSEMPVGKPIAIEFQNIATSTGYQANIDNVYLSEKNTTTETTPNNLLSTLFEDVILQVPSAYSDINAALQYLQNKRIKIGKTATIQVNDCSNQTYSKPINLTHPNGNAIQIIGNTANPEQCALQFNGSHGIVAEDGYTLGKIDGFTLQGNDQSNTHGLYASNQGLIKTGGNIIVSHFDHGVFAINNATILADAITVEENLAVGIYAKNRSLIHANDSISRYNNIGYLAEQGATTQALNAKASYNSEHGFKATDSSSLFANNSFSFENSGSGYVATNSAFIYAPSCNSYNNAEYGYFGEGMSHIVSTSYSNNGTNHSPAKGATLGNSNAYMQ